MQIRYGQGSGYRHRHEIGKKLKLAVAEHVLIPGDRNEQVASSTNPLDQGFLAAFPLIEQSSQEAIALSGGKDHLIGWLIGEPGLRQLVYIAHGGDPEAPLV